MGTEGKQYLSSAVPEPGCQWDGGTTPYAPIKGLAAEETRLFQVQGPEAPSHLAGHGLGGSRQPPFPWKATFTARPGFCVLLCVPGRAPAQAVHTPSAHLFPTRHASPSRNYSHADVCAQVWSLGAATRILCMLNSPRSGAPKPQGPAPRPLHTVGSPAQVPEQGTHGQKTPSDGIFTKAFCSAPTGELVVSSRDNGQDHQPWAGCGSHSEWGFQLEWDLAHRGRPWGGSGSGGPHNAEMSSSL